MAILVGLLLSLAACGDDSSDDADGVSTGDGIESSSSDGGLSEDGGCAILSADEVADATGDAITGGSELPTGCIWSLEDPAGASHEWQSVGASTYDSNLEVAADAGFEVDPVDGLGDDAFRRNQVATTGDLIQTELWVTIGDDGFFVRSAGLEVSDDLLDGHRALAELLVDRIG